MSAPPATPSAAPSAATGYGEGPCLPELFAIVLAGAFHVVTELFLSEVAARWYNVAVALSFAAYLIWRGRRSSSARRAWGMRADNFAPALRAQMSFAGIAGVALAAFGIWRGTAHLPSAFWFTLAIYPVWGIAQQFALQSLVARNLAGLVPSRVGIALVASALFAVSHYPRIELVILTALAGPFLTLIYLRRPNLWAVGIVHGILGSLAFYLALGEDPGAELIDAFR